MPTVFMRHRYHAHTSARTPLNQQPSMPSRTMTQAATPLEQQSFMTRVRLALSLLFSPAQAAVDLQRLQPQAALPPVTVEKVVEKIVEKVVEKDVEKVVDRIVEKRVEVALPPEEGVLHLLSILQREGRLIDFLREDIKGFADAEVGAAVRQVHAGCRKALEQLVTLSSVRSEEEGASVVLEAGFDANEIQLAGDVRGSAPYRGTLAHGGWRVTEMRLPQRPAFVDKRIVAPAEVVIGQVGGA
jgi:hypothetical protein